ncbi:hypothetical protein pb186bvf_009977 [Paramecium bursaria]
MSRRPLAELFFSNTKSQISNISFESDQNQELLQHIQILEKKLQESQTITQKQQYEIKELNQQVQKLQTKLMDDEQKQKQSIDELQSKEQQLENYKKEIRQIEIDLTNKQLCSIDRSIQTDEIYYEQPENKQTEEEIDYIKLLWQKQVEIEHKHIQDIKERLEIKEKAIEFRENKIKWFLEQLQINQLNTYK